MSDLLTVRAGFEVAAFFVSWAVMALLVVLVLGLHARLRRLEQGAGQQPRSAPYSHLLGRHVDELIGTTGTARRPRVLLFLSSGCPSCERVIEEVTSPAWTVPSALLWTDRTAPVPEHPSRDIVLDGGPRISAELGIRVTPFVLVADEVGHIVQAGPVNSLRSLGDLNRSAGAHASANGANTSSVKGDGRP
jgi:hypothetical protein